VFATAGGAALYASDRPGTSSSAVLLVAAAACIQLRLLCNMLDGLLAVEGGFHGTLGDLFNEVPDRAADALLLVGAGYSIRETAFGPALGWAAALFAVLTAYVRLLGGSLGLGQSFIGPMAKQHRMFVLTLACLAAALESAAHLPPRSMAFALSVIVLGSAITALRRLARIAREMSRS
jgi:phosphatidylglycerophosphate synthase